MSTKTKTKSEPETTIVANNMVGSKPSARAKRKHPLGNWSDRRHVCVSPDAHETAKQLVNAKRFPTVGEVFEAGLQLLLEQQSVSSS